MEATAVARQPVSVEPPGAMLAGLEAHGAAFMRAIYAEYSPSEAEGLILRLGAEALDDAAAARLRNDMKAARAAVRQVLSVLQRLGLPAPKVD